MTDSLTDPAGPRDTLLPPRRVGRTLAHARLVAGLSVEDAAAVLPGPGAEHVLADLETGRRAISDAELEALAGLYGLELARVVPARSQLVVDLEEGRLLAGERSGTLPAGAERQEVLERYLAFVHAMRGVPAGERVSLRTGDLEVLAGVLDADPDDLDRELLALMVDAGGPVAGRLRELSGRLLLPVAGVVVAATAVGTLLLVPADDSAAAVTPAVTVVPAAPSSVATPADRDTGDRDTGDTDTGDAAATDADARAEIGTAVVQERLEDGAPGPVRTRG